MSRQDQINLLKRLLHYVETRTTAMAESPWRNEVSAYTDAERLATNSGFFFANIRWSWVLLRTGPRRGVSAPTTMPVCPS